MNVFMIFWMCLKTLVDRMLSRDLGVNILTPIHIYEIFLNVSNVNIKY